MTIKMSEKSTRQCITNYTLLKIFPHLDLWYVYSAGCAATYAGTCAHTLCILPCPQNFTNDGNTETARSCVPGPGSVPSCHPLSDPNTSPEIHSNIPILNLFHSSAFFFPPFKLPCLLHQLSLLLGNGGAETPRESFHWPGCRVSTSVMTGLTG